jgi:hypothetical protein
MEGMDSAVCVTYKERQKRPRHRQHQRRQDGGRLHEVLEQQHQHDVDAQHAVSMARPKLSNSSPMASASPISLSAITPGGRLLQAGQGQVRFSLTSPSGCWLSSISKLTLRWRL